MGVHIYCIAPAGHEPPPGTDGLDGSAVQVANAGPLAVWVSAHDAPPAPSADAAAAHHRVVTAAMTPTVTPVPVRFGQWLDREEAVRERIAAESARWLELLARWAGKAEHGVSVLDPQAAAAEREVHPVPASSGRAYMAALAAMHTRTAERKRRADVIASELIAAVGALAPDSRTETRTGDVLVAVVFLVAWEHVDAYHSAVRRLQERRRDLRFLESGPWPPYSFAG